MIVTKITDKKRIIDIIHHAFEQNVSVNYIVRQDEKRVKRIRLLIEYSYKVCAAFGKVFLSEDRNAAALVLHKKKGFSLRALIWDLQLILRVTGVRNLRKVLQREALIKVHHPSHDFYYLWFIGVHPAHEHLGIGSKLLQDVIADADDLGMPMYLETSTLTNISWYEKYGFQVFHEINVGYKLFFLKRVPVKETISS